jgi:uroporphyrinogen decarboxylase
MIEGFSLLAVIKGGGSKTLSKAKTWLYNYPKETHYLLQRVTDVTVDYLVGQVKAGAQMLQVFESWGGELSPDAFREFSLPYLIQISSRVKRAIVEMGMEVVPMVVFAKVCRYWIIAGRT